VCGPDQVSLTGSARVREHFTYSGRDQTFTAAYIRVQRISGAGPLTASIAGATGTGDVSSIPAVAFASLTGGRWVRIPLTVTLQRGRAYDLAFGTDAATRLKVMPIRAVDDAAPAWASRTFTDGEGQKSADGVAWEPIYASGDQDLQFYLAP
jgi:hypothetical protein